MPTYEYICDACEHEFEQFQSITAPPVKACPECRKKKVRRKISTGAGILFKGGGFYETDYRSKSYSDAAKKDAEAAKPASETKSESKSETKSEPKPADKAPAPASKTESKAKKAKSD
jgi:putative FmdB family regulatory protein